MNNFFDLKTIAFLFLGLILMSSCVENPKSGEITSEVISKTVYSNSAAEPKSLNPLAYSTAYEIPIFQLIFQPLIYSDMYKEDIVPVLAKSRPVIEEINEGQYKGGISYTFELKDNAVWDNGQPVTAEDVLFSLKAIFAPNVNARVTSHYLNNVVEVKTYPDNPQKITVISNERHISGEEIMSLIHVLPEYIYDEKKVLRQFSYEDIHDKEKVIELAKAHPELTEFVEKMNSPLFQREKMMGSGPYNFLEWEAGQRIVLSKKEDWWGNKYKGQNSYFLNNPDTLFFRIIADPNARKVSLKNEELDVLTTLDAADFIEIRNDERMKSLFNFETPKTYIFYFLYLNTKSPKLRDKKVRRAFAHLVDVEDIIKNLYSDMAEPINGPVVPTKDYYNKDLPLIKYNLEKAQALLKEAGWEDTNGNGTIDKIVDGKLTEMELNAPFSNTNYAINLASYLKEAFQDAGIKLETQIMEFNAHRQLLGKREFDLSSGAFSGTHLPDDFTQVFHTDADNARGLNRSGFGNAATDALLEEINITFDKTKRDSLYLKFLEILYEEQAQVYMFAPLERIAIHKRLTGEVSGIRPYVQIETFGFADAVAQ